MTSAWASTNAEAAEVLEMIAAAAAAVFKLGRWRIAGRFARGQVVVTQNGAASVIVGYTYQLYLVTDFGLLDTERVADFLYGIALVTPPACVSTVMLFPKPNRESWGRRSDLITVHSANLAP